MLRSSERLLSWQVIFATIRGMNGTLTTAERTNDNQSLAVLLGQIVSRNHEALAELYDRTSRLVFGLALRMVRHRPTAEDITQEVYLQVWRRAETFCPERGDVTAWIVTIARSRALDRLRSGKVLLARESYQEQNMHGFRSQALDPERTRSASERCELIRGVLLRLPSEQRSVIELAFFPGLTHSEIASRTGLPLGTVKWRIRSGMAQLREQLSFLVC